MKGYIFITSSGYDPARGKHLKDPYLDGDAASLGACMPNIRKQVQLGDHIFVVSGRIKEAPQYVVGGFEVHAKMHATAAYRRFPAQRLHVLPDGQLYGNVIVTADGEQHPLDRHTRFDNRLNNYVLGGPPIVLKTPEEVERGRLETVPTLREIVGRPGNRPIQIIGRCSRLCESQVLEIQDWLLAIKDLKAA